MPAIVPSRGADRRACSAYKTTRRAFLHVSSRNRRPHAHDSHFGHRGTSSRAWGINGRWRTMHWPRFPALDQSPSSHRQAQQPPAHAGRGVAPEQGQGQVAQASSQACMRQGSRVGIERSLHGDLQKRWVITITACDLREASRARAAQVCGGRAGPGRWATPSMP